MPAGDYDGRVSSRPVPVRGRFLVVDGVDGCGKTTQAKRLVARLDRAGKRPLHLREPGSTPLGEAIRTWLLADDAELSPGVEALLVTAARRHMLERVVEPALAEGRDVVCERFHPSTFAYQGVAGGLGAERVLELLHAWAGRPAPDLVLLLDVDAELAARRRGSPSDGIEARGIEFQERVALGYALYAQRAPQGLVRVDGRGSEDAVEEALWEEVVRARS